GDIHQPLHVGAAYFGPNARIVNPNRTPSAKGDVGGNAVSFHETNLHSYWDTLAVRNAMTAAGVTTPHAFADKLVQQPPAGWKSGPFISSWAMQWANEVLPIAAEAHDKLTFRKAPHGWTAHCGNLAAYDHWASEQVTTELNRAGFR